MLRRLPPGLTHEDVIRVVTEQADDEFERLGIEFENLWGRSLQLIDCQNLFCEVDKYARVVHPEYRGLSGRTRIKQRFTPLQRRLPQWYPPKWRIEVPLPTQTIEDTTETSIADLPSDVEPVLRDAGKNVGLFSRGHGDKPVLIYEQKGPDRILTTEDPAWPLVSTRRTRSCALGTRSARYVRSPHPPGPRCATPCRLLP